MTDTVIIAGAGPAGLMLAHELGLAKVPAVVLERTAEPRIDAPGVALNPGALELLDQRGLMDEFREGAFVLPTEHFGFVFLDATNLGRPSENTHLVLQPRLERHLESRAVEAGAQVRRGLEVVGVEQDADGVTVTVRGTDGHREEIRGAYLVGCDGQYSAVRRLAGIEFPGFNPPFHGLVGELLMDHSEIPVELFGVKHHPSGGHFLGAPTEPGVFRVMLAEFGVTGPAEGTPVDVEELREATLRVTGVDLKADEFRWLSRYSNDTRNAEAYAKGRVFLAGDAAHVHYPFNGKGIGTGLHDATNLGWKLAATLKGWAPEGVLDTYDVERRPVGQAACDIVRAQVSLCYPPEEVATLRALLTKLGEFEDVRRYLVLTMTDLLVAYPSTDEAAHPLVGARLPHTELTGTAGTHRLPELLHSARGLLLDLGSGADRYETALDGYQDRIDTVVVEPSADIDAAVVLLRPDGHVAWAAGDVEDAGDAGRLRDALAAWFGAPTA
jgi:2-polyprenyl-6-methoxyphenol hydroxylase-like FAD-dependent oxidoreductase